MVNKNSNTQARFRKSLRGKGVMVSFTSRALMCCAVIAGLVALSGCAPAANGQQKGAAQPSAQSGGTTAVEVVSAGKATRKDLTFTTTQPAQIMAIEQAPIFSKLSAYVGEVLVDYGDKVKKGQPLLKLSAPELDAEVAQKQALLAQAQAELVQAEASARAAEAVRPREFVRM